MKGSSFLFGTLLALGVTAGAQQVGQPQLIIGSTNRTLSVSATETVSMEPEVAILHIGFETDPQDAKSAYAAGARTSNAIVSAVKAAGVADSEIRSESQYLNRFYDPNNKNKQSLFKLTQQWTVKVAPGRAAEILDTAVNAGANSSGEIEWNVKDEKALEQQALDKAATRARENAAVLAKGMGVKLGNLVYVSNELSAGGIRPRVMAMDVMAKAAPEPLAIEPHTVTRQATVYAVFVIE